MVRSSSPLDLHGGTCETVLGFGGVSGYDDVVELVHVGFEVYAEEVFCADGKLLLFVADKRNRERASVAAGGEDKAPVDIGERCAVFPLVAAVDDDARNRFSVFVEYQTVELAARFPCRHYHERVVDDAVR